VTVWGGLTAVLCYHDLCRPGETGSWLKVDVDRFERQIVALKKISTFIRPDALFEPDRLSRVRLNLLLTFDDGFVNNFRLGLPVLQRHGVPALFFISTGHMESGEPFWFDRLIRPIQHYHFDELDLRHLGMDIYRFSLGNVEKRWNGIQRLLEDVKKLDENQDGKLVDQILGGLHGDYHRSETFHAEDRPLNRDEILSMQRSGLCYFGSHGHRHCILTKLGENFLKEELQQSRSILESLLDESVDHISYPNGDVNCRVSEQCRLEGYRFGYSVAPGRVNPEIDNYQIPRILISGFDTTPSLFRILARGLLHSVSKSK